MNAEDLKYEVIKGEHSSVKLNITVEQKDLDARYGETLELYTKEAHIKGFRKGKVPPKVLESKFKEPLQKETLSKVIEEATQSILKELKEAPISRPVLETEVESLPAEGGLNFVLCYDVYPEIKLGAYKNLPVEKAKVSVGKDDIEKEVERLRDRNAVVKEKAGSKVEEKDIITLDYRELDEKGETVEGTAREDFVFTVGGGHNYYDLDDKIIGAEKGKEIIIKKSFPKKHQTEELAGTKKSIACTVKVIKEKILPELDDEFAQDVGSDYKTMEDLRTGIKKKLREQADNMVKGKMIDTLLSEITEKTEMELPESMVRAELYNSWHHFLRNHNLKQEEALKVLKMQEKTQEDLFKEWRPETEKRVKRSLTVAKIIEEEKLSVSDEEAEVEAGKRAEEMKTSVEDLKKNVGETQLYRYIKEDLVNRNLEKFLLENSGVKDGKKISYTDFLQEESHARAE